MTDFCFFGTSSCPVVGLLPHVSSLYKCCLFCCFTASHFFIKFHSALIVFGYYHCILYMHHHWTVPLINYCFDESYSQKWLLGYALNSAYIKSMKKAAFLWLLNKPANPFWNNIDAADPQALLPSGTTSFVNIMCRNLNLGDWWWSHCLQGLHNLTLPFGICCHWITQMNCHPLNNLIWNCPTMYWAICQQE